MPAATQLIEQSPIAQEEIDVTDLGALQYTLVVLHDLWLSEPADTPLMSCAVTSVMHTPRAMSCRPSARSLAELQRSSVTQLALRSAGRETEAARHVWAAGGIRS